VSRKTFTQLVLVGVLGANAGCETKPQPSPVSIIAAQPNVAPSVAQSSSAASVVQAAPKESDNAIVIGERQTFHSTVLNEDRTIWVYTPPGYKQGTDAYPVLYLLDGDGHFHHATGITSILADTQQAPQMIVVGIANTVRDRDLTPTVMKDRANSGGGAKFLTFLKDELRQRIDTNYRTVPYCILVGHSLGGLFGVYAIVNAPGAFNAHICISPSLWWDDQMMLGQAEKFFGEHPDFHSFLYMTVGNEPGKMLDGNNAFAAMLKAKAPKGLEWTYTYMERENHSTIPHRSIYDGLVKLFAGWEPPPTAETLKAFEAHFETLSKKYSYPVKISENALNMFGYRLMEKHLDEAVLVMERNAQLNPDSPNVYDSLAEVYEKSGKLDLAKKNYETAVRKATEKSDTNLPVFKQNLARVSK
jgi:predicted alpha/beta superfamily hydrolase